MACIVENVSTRAEEQPLCKTYNPRSELFRTKSHNRTCPIMALVPDKSLLTVRPGGGGYSHTLPIRVCAAQRGRDFEAPGLERGIHFRGVF